MVFVQLLTVLASLEYKPISGGLEIVEKLERVFALMSSLGAQQTGATNPGAKPNPGAKRETGENRFKQRNNIQKKNIRKRKRREMSKRKLII